MSLVIQIRNLAAVLLDHVQRIWQVERGSQQIDWTKPARLDIPITPLVWVDRREQKANRRSPNVLQGAMDHVERKVNKAIAHQQNISHGQRMFGQVDADE